jgi:hypothetical protein
VKQIDFTCQKQHNFSFFPLDFIYVLREILLPLMGEKTYYFGGGLLAADL